MQAELLPQLVLPLLDQPAGGDDQAPLQVTAEHQLLDVQARHDRLARAGVIGEQKPQRGPLDQLTVDGLDLVRERLKLGGVHGQHRVETAGHPDPERLGGQLELRPIGSEIESRTVLGQIQARLVVAVQQALVKPPGVRAVGQAQGVSADPRRRNHGHRRVHGYPGDTRARSNVFEPHDFPHAPAPTVRAGTDNRPVVEISQQAN